MLTGTRSSGKVARTSATRRKVRLGHVLKYENTAIIAKLMKENNATLEQAQTLFKDTLRFLWLSWNYGGIAPTPVIDTGWHTFILFTMDYQKFCHKYFGQFIHHRPRRPEDVKPVGLGIPRSVEVIRRHFNGNVPKNWEYPATIKDSDCITTCCWSCS